MSIIDDSWNYNTDILENKKFSEFETRVISLRNEALQFVGFKKHNYDYNDISKSHNEELKMLIDKNKQLRDEKDVKHEKLNKLKSQYDKYKQGQKVFSQEIKDKHEALLMAKKYYKKNLKIYYVIELNNNEQQKIFVQFFTETKKESDNYSVRLLRDTKRNQYELLETKPKVVMFDNLKKTLQETNDIVGFLCDIRQIFLKLKKS